MSRAHIQIKRSKQFSSNSEPINPGRNWGVTNLGVLTSLP